MPQVYHRVQEEAPSILSEGNMALCQCTGLTMWSPLQSWSQSCISIMTPTSKVKEIQGSVTQSRSENISENNYEEQKIAEGFSGFRQLLYKY